MHRVVLQFKNERDMRSFFDLSKLKDAEMNMRDLTIICHCWEREIELAINSFDAIILRREDIKD
jgi:hypothetical protein